MKQLLAPIALALALVAPSAQAQPALISTIEWYPLDGYCAFQHADAPDVTADPESWDWVFFTQFGADGSLETGAGFVSIQGRLQQLERLETVQGKDGETRHYRTYGPNPYEVTVTMSFVEEGYESTSYKGFLTVKGAAGEETIAIDGTCGV
jgi:hypothetical protein